MVDSGYQMKSQPVHKGVSDPEPADYIDKSALDCDIMLHFKSLNLAMPFNLQIRPNNDRGCSYLRL